MEELLDTASDVTRTPSPRLQNMLDQIAMKPPCGDSCKLNCSSQIAEADRKKIFTKYWELGDFKNLFKRKNVWSKGFLWHIMRCIQKFSIENLI